MYNIQPNKQLTSNAKDEEGLTPAQLNFVEYVSQGKSVVMAGRLAGFSPKRAKYLLDKNPDIREAIEARRAEIKQKFRLTRDQCVAGMLEAINVAKLTEDPTAQIAGWREIAKMLGHYEPERKVIELSDKREEALAQLQSMDVADLLELAGDDVVEAEFELVKE